MTDQLTLDRLFSRGRTVGRGRRVRCFDPDGRVTERSYEDFAADVSNLAENLRRMGLSPGERVATLAANNIRHLQLMWAVPLAGGVFHAINPRLSPGEIDYILTDADDRFLFVDSNHADVAATLLAERPDLQDRVFGPEKIAEPSGADRSSVRMSPDPFETAPVVADENVPAVLCHTSGTTGNPKGVSYSHRALTLHALSEAMVDGYGICGSDHVLLMVPFCHGAGWGVPYSAFMCGADISILEGPVRSDRVLDVLSGDKITFTAAVPEIVGQIALEIAEKGVGLPDLRILMGGTAPSEVTLSTLRKAGVFCMLCWGMTETLSAATMQHIPAEGEPMSPTQGRPLPLTELSLGPDAKGQRELLVRGPCVVERYCGKDKSAREAGWFPTGDSAIIDDDGTLRLGDRKKDLIKSGGEWISPAALEQVIAAMPGVRDCAVVGVPHPRWGERPLCIVSADRKIGTEEVAETLAATNRFARWQLPDEVVALDALPYTSLRKLDRQRLRDEFRTRFASRKD